jgi:short-subunit dehydrogenase
VGAEPRSYWGAYAASKAAFDALLSCHAQEIERISNTRVAILDPGATRTQMRARAYPGEDPETVKAPATVAEEIVNLLSRDFETGLRLRSEVN